jgi:hypothetical protein
MTIKLTSIKSNIFPVRLDEGGEPYAVIEEAVAWLQEAKINYNLYFHEDSGREAIRFRRRLIEAGVETLIIIDDDEAAARFKLRWCDAENIDDKGMEGLGEQVSAFLKRGEG